MKRGGRRKSAVQGSKVEKTSTTKGRAVSRTVTTAVKNAGVGKTPEALQAYFADQLLTAPMDTNATTALNDYLHTNGAWTGSDAQLQAKSAGLVHLMIGSPEYQFV